LATLSEHQILYPLRPFIACLYSKMAADDFVDIVPGTEVMKDHDGIHYIHARNAAQGPVLLPTPSEYSHDPLVRVLLHCHHPMLISP